MITSTAVRSRRRLRFFVALAISAALNLILFSHILPNISLDAAEKVSATSIVTISERVRTVPTPTPTPIPVPSPIVPKLAQAPRLAPHEISYARPHAPPQPPRTRSVAVQIAHDESAYAKEVAALNKSDDPHAIATIDPASQESAMKSYAFHIPGSLSGSQSGNGIITPINQWKADGRDCYYGRYEYTYPDGAMESGNIVWPFCYDPAEDPFRDAERRRMPFPPPLPGYRLPSGSNLPPIEQEFYEAWVRENPA